MIPVLIPNYAQTPFYNQDPSFGSSAPSLPNTNQTSSFSQPSSIYPQIPSPPQPQPQPQPPSPQVVINTQPPTSLPKATNSEKIRLSLAISCIALGALGIIGGASIGNPIIFGAGLLLTIIGIATTLPSGVRFVSHRRFFHRNHWQQRPHHHPQSAPIVFKVKPHHPHHLRRNRWGW